MIPIAKPLIGEEEKQAVLEVLDSGILAQGAQVTQKSYLPRTAGCGRMATLFNRFHSQFGGHGPSQCRIR